MAHSDLARRQLFLSEHFEALAARPSATKSSILAEALRIWFGARGASEGEERFLACLNFMAAQLARIELSGHVGRVSLALFVRHMLTANAPLADGDKAARTIGGDRFQAFIRPIAHQFARGRRT